MNNQASTNLSPTASYRPNQDSLIYKQDSGSFILSGDLGEEARDYLNSKIHENLIPDPNKRVIENQDYKEDASLMQNPHLLKSHIFNKTSGLLQGSTPFGQAILNPFLREKGYSIADLRQVMASIVPNSIGSYSLCSQSVDNREDYSAKLSIPALIDVGIVLSKKKQSAELEERRKHDSGLDKLLRGNDRIRKGLIELVRRKGNYTLPLIISPESLAIVYDPVEDTGYGYLSLGLSKKPKIISAPILNEHGFFSLEDIDPLTGLPKEVRKERRFDDRYDPVSGNINRLNQKDPSSLEFELIPPESGVSRAYICTVMPSLNLDLIQLSESDILSKTVLVRK